MKLISKTKTRLSPYVTLVERSVQTTHTVEIYHALEQADYVTVFAVTVDGMVPLVRQYRPALERESIELPGGMLDSGTSAEDIAAGELREEIGYNIPQGLTFLGCFDPDPGRLSNRFWGYFAPGVELIPNWVSEDGIDVELVPLRQFLDRIKGGGYLPAHHVALVGLAVLNGLINLD
jgi:8-oxo-dGTP pyrophosphatase MutT (NUDIX family)